MALSALQLEAFVAVAQAKSFSEAAQRLHLTQSALSQRILNLESELAVTLFIRESNGVRMTEIGERFLRYCRSKDALETEFLGSLRVGRPSDLAGVVKIAAFSTYARSVLLPRLGAYGRQHAAVQIDLLVREVHEMPGLLKSGQSDFVFTTQLIDRQEVESHIVGQEENILIEARLRKSQEGVFLDHDEFDSTTADFWKIQKNSPKNYRRAYFDEIYTIVDAVEEGFGRAVVPRHLVADNKRVQAVAGLKVLKIPIYFSYYRQAYFTELRKSLIAHLSSP